MSTTSKKTLLTFLDNNLDFGNNFKDSVLMGLDPLVDADLNGSDDVMNPLTSNDMSLQWNQVVPFVLVP